MYSKMMVPVDLMHVERLGKALETAADLARHYSTTVCYVGVTPETPSEVAHTPQEFASKLDAFAAEQAKKYGLEVHSLALASHDLSVDLDKTLLSAIQESGADLVVMASHVPGFADHIFASNAGAVASHAEVSVFVIR